MNTCLSDVTSCCSLPSVKSQPPEEPSAFAHCKLTGKIANVELEIENKRFSIDVFITGVANTLFHKLSFCMSNLRCVFTCKDSSNMTSSYT